MIMDRRRNFTIREICYAIIQSGVSCRTELSRNEITTHA